MFNIYKTDGRPVNGPGKLRQHPSMDLNLHIMNVISNRLPSLSFGKPDPRHHNLGVVYDQRAQMAGRMSKLDSALSIFKNLLYSDFNIKAYQLDIAPAVLDATYSIYQDQLDTQKNKRFNISQSPVCIVDNCELFIDTLNSLEGGPVYVGGTFHLVGVNPAENNYDPFILSKSPLNISSLKGAPLYVGKQFDIRNTRIRNCEHAPLYIGHAIRISNNPELESLKGLPIVSTRSIEVTDCPKLTTSGLLEGPKDIGTLECDAIHFFGNIDSSGSAYEEFGSKLRDMKIKYLNLQSSFSYIKKLLNTLHTKASNASNRDKSKIEEQVNILQSIIKTAQVKTSKLTYRGASAVKYGAASIPKESYSLNVKSVSIDILLDL
jgi:hypothetical protein